MLGPYPEKENITESAKVQTAYKRFVDARNMFFDSEEKEKTRFGNEVNSILRANDEKGKVVWQGNKRNLELGISEHFFKIGGSVYVLTFRKGMYDSLESFTKRHIFKSNPDFLEAAWDFWHQFFGAGAGR